jgi:hypothetical protein
MQLWYQGLKRFGSLWFTTMCYAVSLVSQWNAFLFLTHRNLSVSWEITTYDLCLQLLWIWTLGPVIWPLVSAPQRRVMWHWHLHLVYLSDTLARHRSTVGRFSSCTQVQNIYIVAYIHHAKTETSKHVPAITQQ